MQYKSYGNKKTAPNRMTRKRLRRDVFVGNKQMKKLQRKNDRKLKRLHEELANEE